MVQYATELDCEKQSFKNYNATWYFNSMGHQPSHFEDDLGNICPFIIDYNDLGQIDGIFLVDAWNTCKLVVQG
jgi:hypothetical protein